MKKIRITVQFSGILGYDLGVREAGYELPQGAVATDLMRAIRAEFSDRFPANLWDEKTDAFHRLLGIIRKDHGFLLPDDPLIDGERLLLFSRAAGG